MSALYDSKTKTMEDYGIRALLTEDNKFQSWLDLEAMLAMAQGELGVIPASEASNIVNTCHLEKIDIAEAKRLQLEIGHGFVPFLKVLVNACPGQSGKYVHYGVTTQNIQQSAQLLVVKKVHSKFRIVVKDILMNLAQIAAEEATTVVPGRTHGRHAIPVTYGYKAAVWIEELLTTLERMEQCEPRVCTVMMGGAVGAFNASGEIGRDVQRRVAELLDMQEMRVPSRNIATHKIEYVQVLCLLASGCHKIAEEVYSTSLEEIGEVMEGFKKGTVGSSTMPHKVNPKLAKGIIANAQKLYSLPAVMLYSCSRPYEADSSSYMLQDATLQEALELMTEIILRTEELTRTLHINRTRMRHNAELNNGMDNSEYIMMMLAERTGKDKAHSKIYALTMESMSKQIPFIEALLSDEDISGLFSRTELEEMLKPENYTGLASVIAKESANIVHRLFSDK
ncbi:class-II fumarase/aspartase family protein [Salmonella enterica]